jgi:hypothetical protein
MTTVRSIGPGTWRLGIHGARNAGKTCYLASLYGFRAQANAVDVAFTDNETIDYLAEQWDKYLAHGMKPKPTGKGMPADLDCQVKCQRRVWQVALRDYAGELVERKGAEDVEELREETRQWLKSCNAILFFIDITEPEDAVRERLNELDLLLRELHRLSVGGDKIARPLAMILTKWDSRPGFNVCNADSEAERTKATEFLRTHPVLGQCYSALEQSGNRVKVFPVSAFGSHRDGHLPPLSGPQPFNIHTPLRWCVEMAEEMVGEKADRDVDAFLTDRLWPRYDKAADLLRQTVTEYNLGTGHVGGRLIAHARSLARRLWMRRGKAAAITATLGIVTVAIALFWDEEKSYKAVLHAYEDRSVGARGIKSLTDEYLAKRNPFKRLHEQTIRERWTAFQGQRAEQDYVNLEAFRREHPAESDAAVRTERDNDYLAVWEGSPQAVTVAGWKMEDDAQAAKHTGRVTHESRYQGILEEVAALVKANKFAEAAEAYHRFLREYPESPHRTELEGRIKDMETAGDDYEWKSVVDFDQKNPNSFEETIAKANQYLSKPKARHRTEAETLVTRTGDRWDWALYEQVRKSSRSGADANSVEAAHLKAMAYLNGTQPRKRMKVEVQKWMEWFNGLQSAKDYEVVVRSMTIPKGSQLEPTFSTPSCRIQVSVNGREYWTGWRTGMEPVYGETLGPFRFKWGETGTFAVRIEGYHPTWWRDLATTPTETDERFIISRLNGPVTVRDKNGKDVTVYLECETVKPPELAAYKDK